MQNSSKTFLNNLAQELKIANAAQHAKKEERERELGTKLEEKRGKLLYAKFCRAINYQSRGKGYEGGGYCDTFGTFGTFLSEFSSLSLPLSLTHSGCLCLCAFLLP